MIEVLVAIFCITIFLCGVWIGIVIGEHLGE